MRDRVTSVRVPLMKRILVKTATLQNGHTHKATKRFATKTATTKTATLHLVKTATEEGSVPKRPHCIWSKRPQREDHYQNGHTAFGQKPRRGVHYQNGHTIAKWPQRQIHLTWSLREGGSLPKRPHYCKTATEGGPLPKPPLYCKTASTRVTAKNSHIIYPLPVSSHARAALSGLLTSLNHGKRSTHIKTFTYALAWKCHHFDGISNQSIPLSRMQGIRMHFHHSLHQMLSIRQLPVQQIIVTICVYR